MRKEIAWNRYDDDKTDKKDGGARWKPCGVDLGGRRRELGGEARVSLVAGVLGKVP